MTRICVSGLPLAVGREPKNPYHRVKQAACGGEYCRRGLALVYLAYHWRWVGNQKNPYHRVKQETGEISSLYRGRACAIGFFQDGFFVRPFGRGVSRRNESHTETKTLETHDDRSTAGNMSFRGQHVELQSDTATTASRWAGVCAHGPERVAVEHRLRGPTIPVPRASKSQDGIVAFVFLAMSHRAVVATEAQRGERSRIYCNEERESASFHPCSVRSKAYVFTRSSVRRCKHSKSVKHQIDESTDVSLEPLASC